MTFKGICSFFVCAMAAILGFSVSAMADPLVHVEGSASFELRYTIAPRVIVVGEPEIQPQPYWVVVVKSADGNTYELDQQFEFGKAEKPARVKLLGKTIEDNFGLSLDGEITYQADHYVWLHDVSHVEPFNIDYHSDVTTQDPFTNWTCQGQMDVANEVYADVWYESGAYIVRLSTAALQGDNRQFTELAYLDSGHINVSTDQTVFNASTTQDSITVAIDNSDAVAQVPGTMTFSVHASPRDLGMSTVKTVNDLKVICNRNR
jgi:hypothetical protein